MYKLVDLSCFKLTSTLG